MLEARGKGDCQRSPRACGLETPASGGVMVGILPGAWGPWEPPSDSAVLCDLGQGLNE